MPKFGEAVQVKQIRHGCQTPGVDSSSRDRGGLHLKRLVVFVMVGMLQKLRRVPLNSVLSAKSEQFEEQVEIDEIAIQTAPCGNGRQVLGCIHSFVIIRGNILSNVHYP